ncbi:MAG: energy-coupling factor ABC transporter permease [Burkholderiaceae bacterium]|jgi:uncharacterized membrane protein|nr:energy-coupling factor ABC transporter permease [Burkholderiales bacterium]MCZ8100474.1 energy-coupling factor ABC transporter permease [Burkholderiales bacterium]MCZ8337054.1 energy-coupling factor ABC transporter permease [Burkholderiaceae bacterium]
MTRVAVPKPVSPHALGALAVLIGLGWTFRTTLVGGPPLHWLVAPLALFVLGPRWAAVAVVGGAGFAAATEAMPWAAVPLAILLDGWLPIAIAWAWLRFVERRLPAHLFVYLFVAVFAGTLIATFAGGAVERLLYEFGSARGTPSQWWVALLILADGEAVTTGFVITGLAVFRPEWLQTFDADRYLKRPDPRD